MGHSADAACDRGPHAYVLSSLRRGVAAADAQRTIFVMRCTMRGSLQTRYPVPLPLNRHSCNHAATCKWWFPRYAWTPHAGFFHTPFEPAVGRRTNPDNSDINLEVFNRTAFLIIIPLVGDKGSQRRVQLHWRSSVAKLNFTKEKKDHIGQVECGKMLAGACRRFVFCRGCRLS